MGVGRPVTIVVMQLNRQEQRCRFQYPAGRKPRIPQPFEDKIGIQRMKLRHLRYRHTRRPVSRQIARFASALQRR